LSVKTSRFIQKLLGWFIGCTYYFSQMTQYEDGLFPMKSVKKTA